jgi:hypothetical protein
MIKALETIYSSSVSQYKGWAHMRKSNDRWFWLFCLILLMGEMVEA